MTGTFVQILARELIEELANLGERIADPSPLMRDIAAIMEESVMYNFDAEGHGEWEKLSDTTKARGREGGKILQHHRILSGSITSRYTSHEAIAGTNDIRAGTHQFGAEKGEYGKTSKGAPIPWGDIPAREFLKLWPDEVEEMSDLAVDYFSF